MPNPITPENKAETKPQSNNKPLESLDSVHSPTSKESLEGGKECSDCQFEMRGNEIAAVANEISRKDLHAQTRMAAASDEMAYWAQPQFWVSVVVATFVVVTFWETRKAADAAQKSANAAEKAITVQRDLGMKQVRGYPSIGDIECTLTTIEEEGTPYLELIINCTNTGQSPLRNCYVVILDKVSSIGEINECRDFNDIAAGTTEKREYRILTRSLPNEIEILFEIGILGTDVFDEHISTSILVWAYVHVDRNTIMEKLRTTNKRVKLGITNRNSSPQDRKLTTESIIERVKKYQEEEKAKKERVKPA